MAIDMDKMKAKMASVKERTAKVATTSSGDHRMGNKQFASCQHQMAIPSRSFGFITILETTPAF